MIFIKNTGGSAFELAWETQNYRIAPGQTIAVPANAAKAIMARNVKCVTTDVPPPPHPPPAPKTVAVKPVAKPVEPEPKVEEEQLEKQPEVEDTGGMNPKIASINLKSKKKKA
jgi:hypothetical protein